MFIYVGLHCYLYVYYTLMLIYTAWNDKENWKLKKLTLT